MIQLRVEEFTAFGRHLRNSPIDLLCHGIFDMPYLTKKTFGWSDLHGAWHGRSVSLSTKKIKILLLTVAWLNFAA